MGRIEKLLEERKKGNLLRALRPASFRKGGKICLNGNEYLDFSSNDYLGLSGHPRLKKASQRAIQQLGVSTCASRLLSGDLKICHKLEERVAILKSKEAALVFNSGYQANIGIISSICKKGDAVFSDKLNHASIIDGIMLSGARLFRFLHNDLNHLEALLKSHRHKFEECLIVTETIFSMDGDRPPLKEIVVLKEKYNCKIMVDEAHATGVFGENGAGVVEEEGLAEGIELVMGTFSKALGSFGAYLVCSGKMREYLINSSRSFIYSTALPPAVIAANIASLDLIQDEPYRRKTLLESADFFRRRLQKCGFEVKGLSQIVPLIVSDTKKALELSEKLQKRGYWVSAIRPPTVPLGEARLRFSLTYYHNKEVLERLINDLSEIYRER